jgi:hypothetical protein
VQQTLQVLLLQALPLPVLPLPVLPLLLLLPELQPLVLQQQQVQHYGGLPLSPVLGPTCVLSQPPLLPLSAVLGDAGGSWRMQVLLHGYLLLQQAAWSGG